MKLLYLICSKAAWDQAQCSDQIPGLVYDSDSGFVMLSGADQLATIKMDTGGQDFVLVSLDANMLRANLAPGSPFQLRSNWLSVGAVQHVNSLITDSSGQIVLSCPCTVETSSCSGIFDPALHGWVRLEERDSFTVMVGPIWVRQDREAGRYGFLADEKHLNRNRKVHGGMFLTFADKALGITAWEAGGRPQHATIQLETCFIRAINKGSFVESYCIVVRQTRKLAFVEGTFSVNGETVATASGIWTCSRGHEYSF